MQIERVMAPTDTARMLVGELEAVLSAGYPPENRHGLALERLLQPSIYFFVASVDGIPAGCGGVALLDGFAELKRMYVREAYRGQGVAAGLLGRLSAVTREHGVTLLRLETGDAQHAALRFYTREGFRVCGAFGDYAVMTPGAITTSVFMEKVI